MGLVRSEQCPISDEIQRLKAADASALRRIWRSNFRKSFPEHLPNYLVIGHIAWQLQAARHGSLSKEEENYLSRIATKPAGTAIARFGGQEIGHQAGTVFVREYDGVSHRVVKTGEGYQWQDREFSSLSAVASAITGTNWNGPRFFGVTKGKRRGRG